MRLSLSSPFSLPVIARESGRPSKHGAGGGYWIIRSRLRGETGHADDDEVGISSPFSLPVIARASGRPSKRRRGGWLLDHPLPAFAGTGYADDDSGVMGATGSTAPAFAGTGCADDDSGDVVARARPFSAVIARHLRCHHPRRRTLPCHRPLPLLSSPAQAGDPVNTAPPPATGSSAPRLRGDRLRGR